MTKICFSGIAGSGVNPLAHIMKLKGYDIVGTDRAFDMNQAQTIKQQLISAGIEIKPQDGSALTPDIDRLYISTAIEDDTPDILAANKENIEIKTRPELLCEIFHTYKKNIAVGGTSGKTTTTAMIGYILHKLNLDPTMINGSFLKNFEKNEMPANMLYGNSDLCVIEADESNGTIEMYNPYITLINNISIDHKSLNEIIELFQKVAQKPSYGLVINKDCEHSKSIKNDKVKTIHFSIEDPTADIFATNIKHIPNGVEYELNGKTFKLKMIGTFNVENALAAISVCHLLGIDIFDSAKSLESFLGTKRRLELIGTKNNISVINDFAHNPEKVLATTAALRNYEGRLIIMFQSHGFYPAKLYGKEIMESFAKTLNDDDILLMPDIFFVGGTVDASISATDLIEHGKEKGLKNIVYTKTKDKAKEYILKNAKSGDRIVVMGARDPELENLCKEIIEGL